MSPIILAAMLHSAPAQTYPNVADLTPFTQPANYMSLRGVLRLRYMVTCGSRCQMASLIEQERRSATLRSTGERPTPFTQATSYMSLRGFNRMRAQHLGSG